MSGRGRGGAPRYQSTGSEDEGREVELGKRKRKPRNKKHIQEQRFVIHPDSLYATRSELYQAQTDITCCTTIPIDDSKSEREIREILVAKLPKLHGKRFQFLTKVETRNHFCPCSPKCLDATHLENPISEWNGKNVKKMASGNRVVYILCLNKSLVENPSMNNPETVSNGGCQMELDSAYNTLPTGSNTSLFTLGSTHQSQLVFSSPLNTPTETAGGWRNQGSNTSLSTLDSAHRSQGITMEETSSGGVQSDTPTDPVSSDPQFYGWVEQYSSNPLHHEEARIVVKQHQSVSCPDLSLNGFKHQENTPVPPVSAKHGSDLNKWQTQLSQLSQQQTVPEAEGEERKDNCEEEMTTDMRNNDVGFTSGYDTFFSGYPTNSVEGEVFFLELQNGPDICSMDMNCDGTSFQFNEIYQDFPRRPPEIKEIVPKRGSVAGGDTFYLSLTDACANDYFQVQFGPSTIPVERCGDKNFKGEVPSSSTPGVVDVYLVSFIPPEESNHVPFEYFDPKKKIEDFVRNDIDNKEKFQQMLFLLGRQMSKINLNSDETEYGEETNQPAGGKTQALSALYTIVNTAAILNAIDFFRVIFSTQAGHSVFKSCKDAQTPLEEIAREYGHEELAQLLEQKHSMYEDYENESDDEVDWKELAKAIEKYQTLEGETAEKKSIPSTSSSEHIQGYLGDGESCTSLSSLHVLGVEGCTENIFEDLQTIPESMFGKEPDSRRTTVAENCPEITFEEAEQTTPESMCVEGPDTCQTKGWTAVVNCSLPPPTTPFVGRNLECSEIIENFTVNHRRIGIITGAPGIGKTAVAVEVGHVLLSKRWQVHYHLYRDHDSSLDTSVLLPQVQASSGISHATLFILDMDMCISNDRQDKLLNAFQSFAESLNKNGYVRLLFVIRHGEHFLENLAFSCNLQPLSSTFAVELLKTTSRKSPFDDLKAIAKVCDCTLPALILARGLIEDGMSETDIINTITSSGKLRIDKALKLKDGPVLIGDESLFVPSFSNMLHLGDGDLIIERANPLPTFAPKEVSSLKRKLQVYDADNSTPPILYSCRDYVRHPPVKLLVTPIELEPKHVLMEDLKTSNGCENLEKAEKEPHVTKRKDAKESAKTESSPSLSPPLVSVREEPVTKSVALEESASDIDLKEPSSNFQPSQDVRPFVEKFSEAVQSAMKSFFSPKGKRPVVAFLLLLMVITFLAVAISKAGDKLKPPMAFIKAGDTCNPQTQFLVEREDGSTSCKDCPYCPPGQTLSIECGTRTPSRYMIKCEPCEPGISFSSTNDTSVCTPCSSCAKDQVVVQNCTVTQDTKCAKRCNGKDRYYDDDKEDCFPCTKCCYDEQDVEKDECKEKLGTGSNMICSFHSSINRCDKSTPFPQQPTTTTNITNVDTNSSQGSKREHTVPPTAQPSHRLSPEKATKHHGLLIPVIISLTLILLVILIIFAVCWYSRKTSEVHHKPAKGTLGIITEGVEMSDKVNRGISSIESWQPLLEEGQGEEQRCCCPRESKLLSSLLDDEPSLRAISVRLDKRVAGAGSYRAVAQTYGFNHYKIRSVLKTNDRGATTALIECLAATHPELTVQEFADTVRVKVKRNDVALLLEAYDDSKGISGNEKTEGNLDIITEGVEMSDKVNRGISSIESWQPLLEEGQGEEQRCCCTRESKLLSSLLNDEPSLQAISECLDAPLKGAGSYRAVAQTYGFNHHKIRSSLERNVRGPTTALIEWLEATHPELTVQEFADTMRVKAKRNDVALLLEAYDDCKEISGNE